MNTFAGDCNTMWLHSLDIIQIGPTSTQRKKMPRWAQFFLFLSKPERIKLNFHMHNFRVQSLFRESFSFQGQILSEKYMVDCRYIQTYTHSIMEYGGTPYWGMTWEKIGLSLKCEHNDMLINYYGVKPKAFKSHTFYSRVFYELPRF